MAIAHFLFLYSILFIHSTTDAHVGSFASGDVPTVPSEHSFMSKSFGGHICTFLLDIELRAELSGRRAICGSV